jgi:hypothetical protein
MFGNIISIFFFYKTGICERWRSYLALETNVNIMDTCKKMNYIVELKYCIPTGISRVIMGQAELKSNPQYIYKVNLVVLNIVLF